MQRVFMDLINNHGSAVEICFIHFLLENSSKIFIKLLINLLKFDQRLATAKNLRNIAVKDFNIIDKQVYYIHTYILF